jgi:hypothetical protein
MDPAADFLFSPPVNLISGMNYELKYKDRVTTDMLPHILEVWLGQGAKATSMTLTIIPMYTVDHSDVRETTGTFTVPTTGLYNLGFLCESPPGTAAVFVDDVTIARPEPNLQLTLQLSKVFYQGSNTYAPDEAIDCLVYAKNNGPGTLTVNNQLSVGHSTYPPAVLSFIVTGPNGPVPFQAKLKLPNPEEDNFEEIATGESVHKYYNLNTEVFDFSQPGTYTIKAVYRNLHKNPTFPVWLGEIVSNTVTLTIQ